MKSPSFATAQLLFITLGIFGLVLPWVQHHGSGLTLNAHELANWSIRHGEEFRGTFVMMTSFLLRGQLLILAVITSNIAHRSRWLIIVLLCIALLPPPDGFLRDFSNPGYRQLMSLALAAALISFVGSRLKQDQATLWQISWSCIGLLSCLYTSSRIDVLYESVQLESNTGLGLMCLVCVYALMILIAGLARWQRRESLDL